MLAKRLYTLFMKRLIWLLAAAPILAALPDTEIRRVLDDQMTAWNRGDIPAFMQGYDESEATTFVSSTVTKGHAQVLANYIKRYPTRDNMGTLTFSNLEIRPLGAEYAVAIGRFHLERTAKGGGEASGIFTLIFHRTGKGWKIIMDHTS
jgi:ketosteroid isomerase-like protein